MHLRRLVSLFLVALLVVSLPVAMAAGPVAAMDPAALVASCPHDHGSRDAPQPHDPRAAKAAAFCHQHCAPAVAPALVSIPAAGSAPLAATAPVLALTSWIDGIDPPPPRQRA
jgi:hypothetical protein